MSLLNIKRTRIKAALQSILRAALGREIPRQELENRTFSYLTSGGSTTSPLFIAKDYKPLYEDDPLGGPDGRNISRSWSAVREDLDTVEEALGEAESRLNRVTKNFRDRSSQLITILHSLDLSAHALESQVGQSFFGGPGGLSSLGVSSSSWEVTAQTNLSYPQTTAVILGGALGVLPTIGGSQDSSGGTLGVLTILNSSDPILLQNPSWIENPFNIISWNLSSSQWIDCSVSSVSDISVIEISVSQGTVVNSIQDSSGINISFQTLSTGGTLWVILSSSYSSLDKLRIYFSAGSVSSIKFHSFSLNTSSQLVWGPFTSTTNTNLYTVSLGNIQQVKPTNTEILYGVSTIGPDGPFTTITDFTKPIIISKNTSTDSELTSSIPDPNTLGYYYYPLSNLGPLQGSQVTAGISQAKVEAYLFNWTDQRDILHIPTKDDWNSPKSPVRTVAMSVGPTYIGNLKTHQTSSQGDFFSAGSALGNYIDDLGQSLSCIQITGTDPNNKYILQPGYNYRFSWSLLSTRAETLTNIPIGLLNPGGSSPGAIALSYLVLLNGSTIKNSNSYFTNYKELSSPDVSFGTQSSDYLGLSPDINTQGITDLTVPPGAAWPPYCGRMNLNLRPGWNTLEILLYIPKFPDNIADNLLGPSASLVFGPNLFTDPATLYESTGISSIRGWSLPWTQLSEFDLRSNTPLGMKEVWSWRSDPQTGNTTGVLLNHNPAESETGFLSLDNKLSGNSLIHSINYLQPPESISLIPGQDPLSQSVWVKAELSTSNNKLGPFVSSFRLTVN